MTIQNTGRSSVTAALEAASPFGAPPQVMLGGGQSTPVEVTLTPASVGPATGVLTVRSVVGTLTLPLSGTGVDPPPCDATVCRDAHLDDVTATCVQSPKPDGTACGDACVLAGTCSDGACIGTPRDCDDQDPCTTDACDPLAGCVHVPRVCVPSSPCAASQCVPSVGCVEQVAPDGVSCGPADCVSAMVCIGGACVSRAVPEGAPCGRPSLCQGPGRCTAGRCDQPDAGLLAPAWRYLAPQTARLQGLVSDERGLYTAECAGTGAADAGERCTMVAFTLDGGERWRTPFSHPTVGVAGNGGFLLLAGGRVVTTVGENWVDAFDVSTGAPAWSTDVSAKLAGMKPLWVGFTSIAADAVGQLVLAVNAALAPYYSTYSLVTLDARSGVVLRQRALPGAGLSIAMDRQSNLFVSHETLSETQPEALTAIGPAGQLLWQRTFAQRSEWLRILGGTHQGRLMVSHPDGIELFSTWNGITLVSTPPLSPSKLRWTFGLTWSDTALFTYAITCPGSSCWRLTDFQLDLVALDNATLARHRAALPIVRNLAFPWLTAKQTALVGLETPTGGVLFEADAQGSVLMQCPLEIDPALTFRTEAALLDGRWAIVTGHDRDGADSRLEVWDVPGYAPARSGWVSPRGGPALDMRER